MIINLEAWNDWRHRRQLKTYDYWKRGHNWFAWRPVRVSDTECAIFCIVKRYSDCTSTGHRLGQKYYRNP